MSSQSSFCRRPPALVGRRLRDQDRAETAQRVPLPLSLRVSKVADRLAHQRSAQREPDSVGINFCAIGGLVRGDCSTPARASASSARSPSRLQKDCPHLDSVALAARGRSRVWAISAPAPARTARRLRNDVRIAERATRARCREPKPGCLASHRQRTRARQCRSWQLRAARASMRSEPATAQDRAAERITSTIRRLSAPVLAQASPMSAR